MSINLMTIEWKLREQFAVPAELAVEIAGELRFANYAREELDRMRARVKSLEQYAPPEPTPPAQPVYHRRSKWD